MFKKLSNFKKDTLSKFIIRESYPKRFVHQFIKAVREITNNFIFYMEQQFYYIDNAEYIPKEHYDTVKKYIHIKNVEWIKEFKFRKVKEKYLL